jgi:hypothetical protein
VIRFPCERWLINFEIIALHDDPVSWKQVAIFNLETKQDWLRPLTIPTKFTIFSSV